MPGDVILVKHHMLNYFAMGLGGSQYVMLETAVAFAKHGFTVYISSALDSPCKLLNMAKFYGIPKEDLKNVGLGVPDERPLLTMNMSGDVLSGPGDVIYLHYPAFANHEVYYPGLVGYFKLIGQVYSLINAALYPLLLKKVKKIIVNSSMTRDLVEGFLGIKPTVVHPPVNMGDILSARPLDYGEREDFVLFVTRISPEKHPERALILAKKLRESGLRVRVVVAGSLSKLNDFYYERLLDYVKRRGLEEYIEFRVNLGREELVDLYRKARAYVHLTPREHFGISVVEAMAAGTPVLAHESSGAWIDVAGRNRLIIEPFREFDDLLAKLTRIISDEREWRERSKIARERAFYFERTRYHERIFRAIEDILYLRGTA